MTALFTRAQYDQLPEGFPAQLIEGDLVRDPAPTYGNASKAASTNACSHSWAPTWP